MMPGRLAAGTPCRKQIRPWTVALGIAAAGCAVLPAVNAARVFAAEAAVVAQAGTATAPAAPAPAPGPAQTATVGTPAPAATTPLAIIDAGAPALAARVAPAVVQILARGYVSKGGEGALLARRTSTGSGVVVGADGYIVTNSHVVAGARTLQVQFPSEHRDPQATSILKTRGHVLGAQLVGVDRETDLAVLKIDPAALGGDAGKLPVLPFADSDELVQGQVVLAFGSPFGLESSVSMGIVSAVARQVEPDAPMVYIQTDAAINPGNSGGALVDLQGRLVGLNTFILSRSGGSEGLGFAVPSNIVRAMYEQIRTTGRVRRGRIGAHAQTITAVLAEGLHLQRDWGVVLADVYPGGPAAQAALRPGDIVLALDGKPMENARQLDVNIYRRRIGDTVELEVLRGTTKLNARVQVVERDDDPGRFMDLVTPERNLVPKLGVLGLEWTRSLAARLPALRVPSGVVVAASSGDAAREEEVFVPGDVIHALNGTPVTTLAGLRDAVEKLHSGDAVVAHVERDGEMVYVAFELE